MEGAFIPNDNIFYLSFSLCIRNIVLVVPCLFEMGSFVGKNCIYYVDKFRPLYFWMVMRYLWMVMMLLLFPLHLDYVIVSYYFATL